VATSYRRKCTARDHCTGELARTAEVRRDVLSPDSLAFKTLNYIISIGATGIFIVSIVFMARRDSSARTRRVATYAAIVSTVVMMSWVVYFMWATAPLWLRQRF